MCYSSHQETVPCRCFKQKRFNMGISYKDSWRGNRARDRRQGSSSNGNCDLVVDPSLGWRSRKMAQMLEHCPVRLLRLGIQELALPAFSPAATSIWPVTVPVASALLLLPGTLSETWSSRKPLLPSHLSLPAGLPMGQCRQDGLRSVIWGLTILTWLHNIAEYRRWRWDTAIKQHKWVNRRCSQLNLSPKFQLTKLKY